MDLRLAIVLHAGLRLGCGRDALMLCCLFRSTNSLNGLLSALPAGIHSVHGDFMTLLDAMRRVWNAAQAAGSGDGATLRALRRLARQELDIGASAAKTLSYGLYAFGRTRRDFAGHPFERQSDQSAGDDWALIARALAAGMADRLFVGAHTVSGANHEWYMVRPATHEHADRQTPSGA